MPFPLPISPLEYYYFCDDQPRYPTAFPVEMRFAGSFDREALLAALANTLARQPMLRARLDDSTRRPAWVASDRRLEVDWQTEGVPVQHAGGPFVDIRSEPGLRVSVRESATHTRLRMQFHHACCDGLAAQEVSEEWLLHYCVRIGTLPPDVIHPLDESMLREREQYLDPPDVPRATVGRWLRDAGATVGMWGKLLARRPAVLAPSANGTAAGDDPRQDDLHCLTGELSADATAGLRHVARQRDVVVNDLLLAEMFHCLAGWNRQRGAGERENFRILMPVDLRGRRDRTMPAANRLSFSFLTRRAGECADAAALLAGIRDETSQIRQQKQGLYFLGGLAFACGIPGAVKMALRMPRPFATVCLSNVGRVFGRTVLKRRAGRVVCGDAVLEGVTAVPPIRPYTHASLAVGTYDHKLVVTLRCDPALFTPADTQSFLTAYCDRLEGVSQR